MTHSIIGFGAIGQALAAAFARQGLPVSVATRRPPEALADSAAAIGAEITPLPLEAALAADVILLALPFGELGDLAAHRPDWSGKILVDATNAYGVPVDQLKGLQSSVVVADAFTGARVVRAFNHLPAAKLAGDPQVNGGRRVIFLAGDDGAAIASVISLIERLGFAPVRLGGHADGGALIQARGREWGPLVFQDLIKFS